MFTKSLRWRLQLWLAFLLASVLAGFGVTVYQLQRLHQLSFIDDELDRRVAVLAAALHPAPPKGGDRFDGRRRDPGTNDAFGPRDGSRDTRGKGPGNRSQPGDRSGDRPGDRPEDRPDTGRGLGERPGRGFGPGAETNNRPGGPRPWENGPDFPFSGGGPPREFPVSAELRALLDETPTNQVYNAVWYSRGKLLKSSTNAPPGLRWPREVASNGQTQHRTRDTYREAVHFTEFGDCLLAGCSLAPHFKAMMRFIWLLSLAGGSVLLAGLAGSWWLAGRAIRPIAEISATAGRISAGNLSERINTAETENELGHLAGVLNSTFARLEAAFAQQKDFVADASHELRTPLAVLISEAQTTLARERSAAEYRETVETCLLAAQQMRRLADSLLELARLDSGEAKLKPEVFDLSAVARQCVELVRPLAVARHLRIRFDTPALQCVGDPQRIGQVITNLLSNATHYNRDGGEIRLTATAGPHHVSLAVADTGEGIPPEDLPHLFERFHRVDKSRSRSSGGAGLGLAISKAIVEAHSGALRVTSEVGVGTTFTLDLPRA